MGLQKSGTTDNFAFFYQNKDHLGTVRETVTSTGAMKQRVNYYPFGGQLVDTLKAMVLNRDFQQYKYNGKEFDGTFGLNTYDYGARQHDPILARWDRIDPLCEKYYGVSPYAYANNNPVKFIDPDGRKVVNSKGVNIFYISASKNICVSRHASENEKMVYQGMMLTPTGQRISRMEFQPKLRIDINRGCWSRSCT